MFFDRGLVDAAAALQHLTGEPILEKLSVAHRYHQRVFLTPPMARNLHDRSRAAPWLRRGCRRIWLAAIYPTLGYDIIILPKIAVADRADFILDCLSRETRQQ